MTARWIVDGFLSGLHRSPRKGFSVEFAEHRPYQAGDEPASRRLEDRARERIDGPSSSTRKRRTSGPPSCSTSAGRWCGAARPPASPSSPTRSASRRRSRSSFSASATPWGSCASTTWCAPSVPPRARTGQWRRLVAALDEPGAGRASHAANALEAAGRLHRAAGDGRAHLRSAHGRRRGGGDRPRAAPRGPRGDRAARARSGRARPVRSRTRRSSWIPRAGVEVAATVGRRARRVPRDGARGDRRVARSLAAYGASLRAGAHRPPFGVPLRRAFAARQEAAV